MKRLVLFLVIFSFWGLTKEFTYGQVQEKVNRPPAVAGSFYPAKPQELRAILEGFFNQSKVIPDCKPIALIVPHAGYVFSGAVAAAAYKQLNPNRIFRHIFIIGPNHRVYFNGVDIYTGGDFTTPLGSVPIDPLASELVKKNRFISSDPVPHKQEHCIEVQLPFLQYILKKPFAIVPILIGGESRETTRQLASVLAPYFTEDNLFIISSDFSHYPDYASAQKADRLTADAIMSNNSKYFLQVKEQNERDFSPGLETALCGWMPVLTLLQITEKDKRAEFRKILYRNSGDSSYGDRDKVVGYCAIAVTRKNQEQNATDFQMPESDKIQLLKIARNAITTYLTSGKIPVLVEKNLPASLMFQAGAFVTLNENQQLRGCIGNFSSQQPLYKTVQEMAIEAATGDTRFTPVEKSELNQIEIEISVLTPLKKISSIAEFKLGRDGIYIKKGNRAGTFLPQVAQGTGWDVEEFMGHCSQDKAFIGWNGWKDKDTELYTYQALVFREAEFPSLKNKK